MGAWGIGNFENDDAGDWAADFRTEPKEQMLHEAFAAVNASAEYIERDLGGHALAAAEVLAAAKGRPCRDIPAELLAWAQANPAVAAPSLTARALEALPHVADPETSETAELWAEGEDFEEWLGLIEDLKRRLA